MRGEFDPGFFEQIGCVLKEGIAIEDTPRHEFRAVGELHLEERLALGSLARVDGVNLHAEAIGLRRAIRHQLELSQGKQVEVMCIRHGMSETRNRGVTSLLAEIHPASVAVASDNRKLS
jgi:hypothetical protein